METRNPFSVDFPIEIIERWVREEADADGMVLENQSIFVDTLTYNKDTGYVQFTGDIVSRIDA